MNITGKLGLQFSGCVMRFYTTSHTPTSVFFPILIFTGLKIACMCAVMFIMILASRMRASSPLHECLTWDFKPQNDSYTEKLREKYEKNFETAN